LIEPATSYAAGAAPKSKKKKKDRIHFVVPQHHSWRLIQTLGYDKYLIKNLLKGKKKEMILEVTLEYD